MAGELFDKRSGLLRELFSKGQSYGDFIAAGAPNHQTKWKDYEGRIALTPAQRDLISTFVRKMNVLVLSGTWCGDCARQCPMLAAIEGANNLISMRYFDNKACPELADELRIHGASRVPAILIASEDFFEVSRFGDRTLSAYRRKAARELGPACDAGIVPPSAEELALELSEWVDQFERAHHLLRLSGMLRERYKD